MQDKSFSVLGCCVSRDIFRLGQPETPINNFLQYSSIVSMFGEQPIFAQNRVSLKNIPNGTDWRKRCLNCDVNKSIFEGYQSVLSDYLIIDATDTRLNLIKYSKGYESIIITKSLVYRLNKDFIDNTFKDCKRTDIDFIENEDEILNVYISKFVDKVKSMYPLNKIILNACKMVYEYIDRNGILCKFVDTAIIDKTNDLIENMNAKILELLPCKVLPMPNNIVASASHSWGLFPLHYADDYYLWASNAIDIMIAEQDWQQKVEISKQEFENKQLIKKEILIKENYMNLNIVDAPYKTIRNKAKQINFLVSSDNNMISYVQTLIVSIAKSNSKSKMWIMQSDWQDTTKERTTELCNTLGVDVEYVFVDKEDFASFKQDERRPAEANYFLMAHKYLPEDLERCIYLHTDALVKKDLTTFYNLDIGDCLVACCPESDMNNLEEAVKKNVGQSPCLNSGSVLMDLTKIRAEGIEIDTWLDKIDMIGYDKYAFASGLFNSYYISKAFILNAYKFCMKPSHSKYYLSIEKDSMYASIIHFAGNVGGLSEKPINLYYQDVENCLYFVLDSHKPLNPYVFTFFNDWWNLATQLPNYEAIKQIAIETTKMYKKYAVLRNDIAKLKAKK